MVRWNRALLLEFSLFALRTEQDSQRARGLKSACFTGAFSANQRKQSSPIALLIVRQVARAAIAEVLQPEILDDQCSTALGPMSGPYFFTCLAMIWSLILS